MSSQPVDASIPGLKAVYEDCGYARFAIRSRTLLENFCVPPRDAGRHDE